MRKETKKDIAIAIGGMSVIVLCLVGVGWLFFNPVASSQWTIVLQVILVGFCVSCVYLVVKYFERKRIARLLEEEERTGLKLL